MRTHFLSVAALPVLVAVLAPACGPAATPALEVGAGVAPPAMTTATTTTLDHGMPSTIYPAPHQGHAPTVSDLGGPVVASPVFVPVFFAGYDAATQKSLLDFEALLGGSSYWAATTSQYGVGPGQRGAPILLAEAAPAQIDSSAIATWLAGKIASGAPGFPAPDADTIYVLHYPAATTVTVDLPGITLSSCHDFGGYHGAAGLGASSTPMAVPYAVVLDCGHLGPLSGLDLLTGSASHELIEAATNPLSQPQMSGGYAPAYQSPDETYKPWVYYADPEVADLCEYVPGAFAQLPGLPYTVQRSWSNEAALAGHEPCVPALPGSVYFAAVPVLPDTCTDPFDAAGTFPGVSVTPGHSRTIEIDLFSDADTGGPWTVTVADVNTVKGRPANLDLQLDRTTGQNGEKIYLTITPLAPGAGGPEGFVLTSTLGAASTVWVGAVCD